jgi:hypothetical protein
MAVPEMGIYRTAKLLIDQHGAGASGIYKALKPRRYIVRVAAEY